MINGARPSAKNDTLDTILARIPASRVLRVEVASGDVFGAEYAGRPQVLNLVLTSTGGLAGTLDTAIHRNFRGDITPDGQHIGAAQARPFDVQSLARLRQSPLPGGRHRHVHRPSRTGPAGIPAQIQQ